jgi:hypothetical protein
VGSLMISRMAMAFQIGERHWGVNGRGSLALPAQRGPQNLGSWKVPKPVLI